MAKANEPVGELTVKLLIGDEYQEATVPAIAFVGPLAVHETIADHRLAEAKSAAFSVTLMDTGLGLVNGVSTKKLALAFAEEALAAAEEHGLDLGVATQEQLLQQQPAYSMWLMWALTARAELKTRKGFLYEE